MSNNKSKWGINLDKVKCPECGAKQPSLRIPKYLEQLIFGGWNCENCSCRMDKYGNKIVEGEK